MEILQVHELVPDEILKKSGAKKARAAFAHIPVARVGDLADANAIIFGTPTRYGNMCAQMRNFLDQTGGLWAQNASILPDLFVEVVRFCASLGMMGLGYIAFDGTKLKANASLRQSRDRDSLEKEIKRIKEQALMLDTHLMRIWNIPGRGGLDACIPDDFFVVLEKKDEPEKRYHKSNFQYDQMRDVYICPEGQDLKCYQEMKRKGKPPFIIYRGKFCKGCAVREECTKGPARRITRDGRESLVEAMREKLRSEEGREIY